MPIMILFGALFSLFEPKDASRSPFTSQWFWHWFVFITIFNVAVVYAAVLYPDWMWMYFVEYVYNSVPELIYLFVFLYYLPYILGYYIGRDLKKVSLLSNLLFLILLGFTEAWLIIHLFDRYAVIGTRQEFFLGKAVSLFGPQNPIGPVMNSCIIVMAAYFLLVLILFRRSRRLNKS